jgi:hypothetical protein
MKNDIDPEILKTAQELFEKLSPHLCKHTVNGKKVRDPYYLDNPERSDTMTAFIEGVKWTMEKRKEFTF